MQPDSLTPKQIDVASSPQRFRVLASGRRFGKTYLAIYELMRAATAVKQKVWYVAPTYKQAKQIAWEMLKEAIHVKRWQAKKNESDLSLTFKQNGSSVHLKGADNYDSLRGVGINFLVIDEAADVKPEAWFEVLRPTLSDTGGEAFFIGTPKGRNWFYDLFQKGQSGDANWRSWQFATIDGGNVPPEEIEWAKDDLDELTFNQEYMASFVNFTGRAYYPFEYSEHVTDLEYNPDAPLALCFDFNVEPGICAIIQEFGFGTGVINEVYIPKNSNTLAVCRKIIELYKDHRGNVKCYGDATGGARGTAQVQGSDWELVRNELLPVFGQRLWMRVPRSNPQERLRVNSVNSRLKSQSGEIKLKVDRRCKYTIKDFEGVVLLKGGSGEIDKGIDPSLTHLSDSIGYFIFSEHPVVKRQSTVISTGSY